VGMALALALAQAQDLALLMAVLGTVAALLLVRLLLTKRSMSVRSYSPVGRFVRYLLRYRVGLSLTVMRSRISLGLRRWTVHGWQQRTVQQQGHPVMAMAQSRSRSRNRNGVEASVRHCRRHSHGSVASDGVAPALAMLRLLRLTRMRARGDWRPPRCQTVQRERHHRQEDHVQMVGVAASVIEQWRRLALACQPCAQAAAAAASMPLVW
jgi:hypothetical protein